MYTSSNSSAKDSAIRSQSSVNKQLSKTNKKSTEGEKINPKNFEKFSTICERKTTDYSHKSKNCLDFSAVSSENYFNRKNSDTFSDFKISTNYNDLITLQKDITKQSRKLVNPSQNNRNYLKSPSSSRMSSSAKSVFSKKISKGASNNAYNMSKAKHKEKENLLNYSKMKKEKHQMSMYVLPKQTVINDISGYTTKSRKNLVDNNSNIVQKKRVDNCSSAILQDLNTEDDYVFNSKEHHDTDECPENKESDGVSLMTSKSCITDKRLKEITKKLIQTEHDQPWFSSNSKVSQSPSCCISEFSLKSHYASSNKPKSPERKPKWRGSEK